MATATTAFNAAIVASGNTTSGPLNALLAQLTAYATLIPAAIQAMEFLDQYQSSIAESTAGAMLWAAKDSLASDDVCHDVEVILTVMTKELITALL